jgi:hypothetical protein
MAAMMSRNAARMGVRPAAPKATRAVVVRAAREMWYPGASYVPEGIEQRQTMGAAPESVVSFVSGACPLYWSVRKMRPTPSKTLLIVLQSVKAENRRLCGSTLCERRGLDKHL